MTDKAEGLEEYREEIRQIDEQITKLFVRRMETAGKVADYKKNHDLPVLDSAVERRKLNEITEMVPEDLKDYARQLYTTVFALSRDYQTRRI